MALWTREQFASSHFDSSAQHRIKPPRKVHKPSAQLNPKINSADTIRLDTERRVYVAQRQAIRNIAPAYTQLPIAARQSAPVLQPPPPLAVPNQTQTTCANTGFVSKPPSRRIPRAVFSSTRVTPLPETRPVKGRTWDISNFYSTPGSLYTGRVSDRNSLARHQDIPMI